MDEEKNRLRMGMHTLRSYHSMLLFSRSEMKTRIAQLEGSVKEVAKEEFVLMGNVAGLEHEKIALGATFGQIKLENEGLSIHLKSVETDLLEKDRLVEGKASVLESLEADVKSLFSWPF